MTVSTAQQIRQWQGPALLSLGLRPFFLFAALWAALAMLLWIVMLSGRLELPVALDPVAWHAHAFLFGYLGAVLAGFLLTAVPNWTGGLPVVGWRLAGLVGLWLAARAAMLVSAWMPFALAAMIELAFPMALAGVIAREILAGRNWRNLPVLGLLTLFIGADLAFLLEASAGGDPVQGIGLRLGLSAAVMMIALIGGRIIPSFTRNWLVREERPQRPAAPMQPFDHAVLGLSASALIAWVLFPEAEASAVLLLAGGMAQILRLARWKGLATLDEPLVAILHLAYAWIPAGFIAIGAAILWPDRLPLAGAEHLWMAGAIGTMTLAVMTRAALGHTGHTLHAGTATIAIYAAINAAVLLRLAAVFLPQPHLLHLSGLSWILAFAGFGLSYGPILLRRRA